MESILNELYYHFYQPLKLSELRAEADACREQLVEVMEKPERMVLIQLVDAQDAIADELARDSFACGLKLGLCLSKELMDHRICVHEY